MNHPALTSTDLKKLSVAVQNRYRHYHLPLDETISSHVCAAAIAIYQDGAISIDDISRLLIARVPPGQVSAKMPQTLQ